MKQDQDKKTPQFVRDLNVIQTWGIVCAWGVAFSFVFPTIGNFLMNGYLIKNETLPANVNIILGTLAVIMVLLIIPLGLRGLWSKELTLREFHKQCLVVMLALGILTFVVVILGRQQLFVGLFT
jgi:hypothetical protein